MTAAVDLTSWSTILSGFAILVTVCVIPAGVLFHKRVVRPLSFVLGLKAEDSPTGEKIPTIPQQLAQIRAELHPNGGSSMRDSVDRAEKLSHTTLARVIDLEGAVRSHVADDAASFRVISGTLDALLVGQRGAQKTAIEVAKALRAEGTTNGLTAANLLERAEGRRILLEKPSRADRTPAEQHYVDILTQDVTLDPGA